MMKTGRKMQPGFTIVELLAVLVVVAILAAITVVAYNGVQNKANDSAVTKDLHDFAKQFEIFRSRNMRYPSSAAELGKLESKISKSAYMTKGIGYNFIPCTTADNMNYGIAAISRSGKRFYVSNSTKVEEYTGTSNWTTTGNNYSIMCTDSMAGSTVISGGAGVYNGNWRSWTDS